MRTQYASISIRRSNNLSIMSFTNSMSAADKFNNISVTALQAPQSPKPSASHCLAWLAVNQSDILISIKQILQPMILSLNINNTTPKNIICD